MMLNYENFLIKGYLVSLYEFEGLEVVLVEIVALLVKDVDEAIGEEQLVALHNVLMENQALWINRIPLNS